MGNELSAVVPSQIQPVETYLVDLEGIVFTKSLGSTRFLKVARVELKDRDGHVEGRGVVKVFVLHDPSFSLQPYRLLLDSVNAGLQNAHNCAPFRKVVLTDKCGILIRQFGKETLFDRISCRPFLVEFEKLWICFQLLKALEQCLEAKICHGDIKCQNVLISSYNWVMLTDFASFKPTFLPFDNPSDFTYFFDTSRRGTCCLAPERFCSNAEIQKRLGVLSALPDDLITNSELTHQMDIFSAGCVIAELLSDGKPTFLLGQLLRYRDGNSKQRTDILDNIINSLKIETFVEVKNLLREMLQVDPKKRLNAPQLLDKYRDVAFPEIFYSFVWPYVSKFVAHPLLTTEEKVLKLTKDKEYILEAMGSNDEASILIVNLATSQVRGLNRLHGKLDILRFLKDFATEATPPTVILDRILPYLMYLVGDGFARIRAEAVYTVTNVMQRIRDIPRNDSRIFLDYILPKLAAVSSDKSSLVRMALASSIAVLADTAAKCLEAASHHLLEADPQVQQSNDARDKVDYQAHMEIARQAMLRKELVSLQDQIQDIVVTLLCDPNNAIRRTLVESGLSKLCVFFGRGKASDILLSHMITFLNDKSDWRLRATFYECCPAVAAYIGWSSTLILKPLLQQGLRDFEEMVVFHTLCCLSNLAQLGLLQKPGVYEILQDAVPFLSHPNNWLRIATVGFISAVARKLTMADVHCKVIPVINSFLRQPLIKLDKESILLRCLKEPLPRQVWDLVIRSHHMPDLMDFLRDKHLLRQLSPAQTILAGLGDESTKDFNGFGGSSVGGSILGQSQPNMQPENPQLAHFYQKLGNQGLTESMEERLLTFRETLVKMRKMKDSVQNELSPMEKPGQLDLANHHQIKRRTADLSRTVRKHHQDRKKKAQKDSDMNAEWQEMFGGVRRKTGDESSEHSPIAASPTLQDELQSAMVDVANGADAANELVSKSVDSAQISSLASDETLSPLNQSVVEQGVDTAVAMDKIRLPSLCRMNLDKLVEWKREEYRRTVRSSAVGVENEVGKESRFRLMAPLSWRPEGRLVAHLHEHRGAIQKLFVHPESRLFGSCSLDGSLKLWNSKRFEGKHMTNRSQATFTGMGDKIRAADFLYEGESIVCSGDNCQVLVLRTDRLASSSSREPTPTNGRLSPKPARLSSAVTAQFKTDPVEEGPLLDLATWSDGFSDLVLGYTHHGYLVCWDLRVSDGSSGGGTTVEPVWKWKNPSHYGMVTSFCLDSRRQNWACLGTLEGKMVTWDLRFQIDISSLSHPSGQAITGLWTDESESEHQMSRVWAATKGTGEVGLWDLETGSRITALWHSDKPPLSYKERVGETVSALFLRPHQLSPYAISGASAGSMRFWDFKDPMNSYPISLTGEPEKPRTLRKQIYKSQMVEGVKVMLETKLDGTAKKPGLLTHNPMDLQITNWHKDAVTGIACAYTGEQWFLISSSRDGVIKVWK